MSSTLKYDHPNWQSSIATLACKAADDMDDDTLSAAYADIMSSLESELDWLVFYEDNVDVDGWAQWLENGEFAGNETIESLIVEMQRIQDNN
jgi:hypothetical protein